MRISSVHNCVPFQHTMLTSNCVIFFINCVYCKHIEFNLIFLSLISQNVLKHIRVLSAIDIKEKMKKMCFTNLHH